MHRCVLVQYSYSMCSPLSPLPLAVPAVPIHCVCVEPDCFIQYPSDTSLDEARASRPGPRAVANMYIFQFSFFNFHFSIFNSDLKKSIQSLAPCALRRAPCGVRMSSNVLYSSYIYSSHALAPRDTPYLVARLVTAVLASGRQCDL